MAAARVAVGSWVFVSLARTDGRDCSGTSGFGECGLAAAGSFYCTAR